ncbi:DUF6220 domain-containing protein [Nonomuraea harbinensis]|uniref:DUF6220 domain-containing protein n=1 Tax=Nonomuraea harbinensis TaxID=1286938 RepID=A0ABW1BZX8_9ACTN|nr:DUF6220 domain-containing protein [Nonomuraea harbinensis]
MRKLFTGLAALLMLAIVAQFFLAAVGAFDSAPTEEAFAPHRLLGYSMLVLAVLTTIIGAVARMPGQLIGRAGLVVGLVIVQVLIREIAKAIGDGSTAGPLVFGLHALNALFIMGVAESVLRRSRQTWEPAKTGRLVS